MSASLRVPERTTVQLLLDPTFGRFFVTNLTSNCGNWIHNVAAATAVYEVTGSATLTGVVSGALWIGSLFLQPWAGALSDRVDRRMLVIVGTALSLVAAAVLGVWSVAVGVEGLPGPWPIIGTTVVIGIGNALVTPPMQALVPALVPPADLDQAVALTSVTFTLGRAVGPALAAGILLLGGAEAAFVVNAVTFVPLLAVMAVIRPRPTDGAGTGDGSVRAALAYVRDHPDLVVLLTAALAIGWTSDPINTLTPPMADELGGGEAMVGMFVAAFGGGAATMGLLARRLRARAGLTRMGIGGLCGFAAGMVLFAASPTPALAGVALAASGLAFLAAITSVTTRVQRTVDEGMRGRVMALWGVAFLGSRPVAALANGVLADLVGARPATAVAASAAAAAAVLLWRRPVGELDPT